MPHEKYLRNNAKLFDDRFLKDKSTLAGVDEAGRGCWAGPLVFVGVILNDNFFDQGIKDSKKLSASKRKYYRHIIESHAIKVKKIVIGHEKIDFQGLGTCCVNAIKELQDWTSKYADKAIFDYNPYCLSNENMLNIPKADQKSFVVACASILAKEYKDEILAEYNLSTKGIYDWNNNKGYGTLKHRQAINIHGISKYHRTSYKPIQKLIPKLPKGN